MCWRHRPLVQLMGRPEPHRTWWAWCTINNSSITYFVGLRNSLSKGLKHSVVPYAGIFYTAIMRWEGLSKWKCSSQLPWTAQGWWGDGRKFFIPQWAPSEPCLTATVFHFSIGKVELISFFLSLSLDIWTAWFWGQRLCFFVTLKWSATIYCNV